MEKVLRSVLVCSKVSIGKEGDFYRRREETLEGGCREEITRKLIEEFRKTGDIGIRNRIVAWHQGLVRTIARRFICRGEPLEDLIQEGFIGLLKAIELYDPSQGAKFSTYATYKIAGCIEHYLRDKSRLIRRPAWIQEWCGRVQRETNRLRQTLGREPSLKEIADSLKISLSFLASLREAMAMGDVGSLDAPKTEDLEDHPLSLLDQVASSERGSIDLEERISLSQAINRLRPEEALVVSLFYLEGLTYKEIAQQMGITVSKVRHLVASGLKRLKILMNADRE